MIGPFFTLGPMTEISAHSTPSHVNQAIISQSFQVPVHSNILTMWLLPSRICVQIKRFARRRSTW